MRDRLWLVHNGVPFEKAFTLPPEDVAAYGIVFGEFAGNEFDIETMSWVKQE